MAQDERRVSHPFAPVYDSLCDTLILGTFPSVRSRENGFYYGHPQNRFWRVLAALYGADVPRDIDEKRALLLANHIALWDVLESCRIVGSSDQSIREAVPNDIAGLIAHTRVTRVFANGAKAGELYRRYALDACSLPAVTLPSTSPANAAWTLPRLIEGWRALV